MRVIKACGWRNEVLWGSPAARVSTIIRGCYTGKQRQMLQIAPRPEYFPPLKIYFLPPGSLSPSPLFILYFSDLFPTCDQTKQLRLHCIQHSPDMLYKSRLLLSCCFCHLEKKLIGSSIKLLIVKYWTVYSDLSMFSSSINTVCQDLIREQITQDQCGNPVRPVFHQWRWSWVVFEIVTQFSNSPSPKSGHWQQDYLYCIGWKSALSTISTGN